MRPQTFAVSATPGNWEMEQTGGVFAEQVIRPTGLIDPPVEIKPVEDQVQDLINEARITANKGYRTLVTTLTKRMAEDLTEFMHEAGLKVRYMHSDVETLERIELIRDLRSASTMSLSASTCFAKASTFPNAAGRDSRRRQGGLPALRNLLIQTIGRAARNVEGRVILYADRITGSMERALNETDRRRSKQLEYNAAHGITPTTIKRNIADIIAHVSSRDGVVIDTGDEERPHLVGHNLKTYIADLESRMRKAAADLEFEEAGRLRDEIRRLEADELGIPDGEKRAPVFGNSTEGKPGTRKTRYGKQQQMRMNKRAGGKAVTLLVSASGHYRGGEARPTTRLCCSCGKWRLIRRLLGNRSLPWVNCRNSTNTSLISRGRFSPSATSKRC
jgi:excinuclease ABC subunit B